MMGIRDFTARLRTVLQRSRADREFDQELQSHVDMLTDDNLARGMAPDEARRAARLRVGSSSSLSMRHRDARGLPWLEDVIQDLRFAGRLIGRDKGFSAAAVIAIALGIGANAMGFTIINAAFLRGFQFEAADRLQHLSWRLQNGRRQSASYTELEDWRARLRSFSALGGYMFSAINISDDHAPPEQTQGAWIGANFFDVLRQRPLLGRAFLPGEDQRGADPVVIIGHEIWSNRFARDPNVLGRTLRINGREATIVGVMPQRMKFPDNSELWVPLIPTDAQLARDSRGVGVIGRLADGVDRERAAAEVDAVARQMISAHVDVMKNITGGQVETLIARYLGGQARPMFITIMGAVSFVLLIACANVANLLLSRAIYRSREVAVRYSLGATRWRVIRQLLIESVALSSLGGVLGLVLAGAGINAFDAAVQIAQPPYWLSFAIDYRVLAYVAAICVITGIVFGLAPALHISRDDQHDALKEGGRGTMGQRRAGRFGNGLVVAELALTVVLLSGAGLMVRSFFIMYQSDPGFSVEGLTRMRMQLPPSNYPTAEARLRFFDQLAPRLAAIPGVTASAMTTSVPPLDDAEWQFAIDGAPEVEDERRPWVATVTISPSYFETLGVAMIGGRDFDDHDGTAGAEHVVINQVMADRYFAGENPVGRRIRFLPRRDEFGTVPQPWRTIVGVSARFQQGSTDEAFYSPIVYLPLRQAPPRTTSLLIRSALPPANVMTAVRGAVQSIDADQPVFSIQTLAWLLAEERSFHRIFGTLFGVLAVIALTLSAVGIYGVMAYAVTQRTQEIGVRMAVGAQRWQVSWLFFKRGLTQLILGLALGVPAALALATVVRFNLVEIEPNDPVTMFAIIAILVSVSMASCLIPVRKAARVDPVNALRAE
jgi:predicted permease